MYSTKIIINLQLLKSGFHMKYCFVTKGAAKYSSYICLQPFGAKQINRLEDLVAVGNWINI